MNPGQNGNPPAPPAPPLTWPIGVQVALCLIVTACLFFFLGRWSQNGPNPQAEMSDAHDRAVPALDLNRATKGELRLLPGLGDTLAQRVIDYRDRAGAFRCVDDLRKVGGIGPKTLERLRPYLFVAPVESFTSTDGDDGMTTDRKAMPRVQISSTKLSGLTQPINVNAADQAGLQKLPGIGPKLSQRIIDERAKAPFKKIEDLRRVAGIGPKTLEKLKPHVTLE